MSHDHCPSKHPEAREAAAATLVPPARGSARYFRGLEELAGTTEFRAFVERELPRGASELLDTSRRSFLKLMGAGLALAGAATMPACRRPDHTILPYSRSIPEDVIPGKALYYATSLPLPGGYAEGLIVETHEGRPTKVEGNPLHPLNQGRSSVWAQASVLDLYDPDRLKSPSVRSGAAAESGAAAREATWDDFAAWSATRFKAFDADQGASLAFIVEKASSPTRDALRDAVLKRWPKALWAPYEAFDRAHGVAGSALAFGKPMRQVVDLTRARVIVALERDFLHREADSLSSARGWAAGRAVMTTKDAMNRVYSIESAFSNTGAVADHRLALSPARVEAFAVALARSVLTRLPVPGSKALSDALAAVKVPEDGLDARFLAACADDLLDVFNRREASAVLAGPSLSPAVQAVLMTLNHALGNTGKTITYLPESADVAADSFAGLKKVVDGLNAGSIKAVVCLATNPAYTAPADLKFAEAFVKAADRVVLAHEPDETTRLATWSLNLAHPLESWGDTEAYDGTIAPIQPMIAPLFGARSVVETLAIIVGNATADGYELVRNAWRAKGVGGADFEKAWRRALHDGVLANAAAKPAPIEPDMAKVAAAVGTLALAASAAGGEGATLEVAFTPGAVHDGRFANNAWIQELPDPASRVVWDNPALVSVATARRLGLEQSSMTAEKPTARLAKLTLGGASVTVPVWAVPGLPDDTVLLTPGYGRSSVGLVGENVGFDVGAVRTTAGAWKASGASLAAVTEGPRVHTIACTQLHGSMEGRALVREVDLPAWQKHGDEPPKAGVDSYGRPHPLNFAEQLEGGEFNHMPAGVGVYQNPLNRSTRDVVKSGPGTPREDRAAFSIKPQWGMSIDLSSCTGCNVCTIACQAENNIPVVGKAEVIKGREMTWIRVDRYFRDAGSERGDEAGTDGIAFQPVACVHCENAPCEVVCPVNATVHGDEGHNYMVYNRCIGTRYCANNCPYKVRRFNFFEYGQMKVNGSYLGRQAVDAAPLAEGQGGHKVNPNLIPPRLREKLDEISRMQKNPNVTIRSRGVMEKCTYCIQRTNELKIELKLKDPGWRPDDGFADGLVQTACQQACPTGAIVFGDILDEKSRDGKGSSVRELRQHNRSYLLLGYLNTRPRTTYLAGVRNPNPVLRKPVDNPFEHHHDHDHDHDHAPAGGGHAGGPHGADRPTAYRRDDHDDEGYRLSLAVLGDRA